MSSLRGASFRLVSVQNGVIFKVDMSSWCFKVVQFRLANDFLMDCLPDIHYLK